MQVITHFPLLFHSKFKYIAVIQGRDEFPDVDLVLPWSAPHLILRSDHYEVKPFYVKVGGEEIRVTTIDIETNAKSHTPYFVSL